MPRSREGETDMADNFVEKLKDFLGKNGNLDK